MLNDLFYAVLGMLPWTCALIAALLVGMTCCAAKAVFGSCAEVGVQQTVRNLEDFFLWLRDVWALARVKLNLCMVTV